MKTSEVHFIRSVLEYQFANARDKNESENLRKALQIVYFESKKRNKPKYFNFDKE